MVTGEIQEVEDKEQSFFITNMYAIVKNNTVIDWFVGSLEDAKSKYPVESEFIFMNEENSPAFLNGTWDGNKFYPPLEEQI